MLWPLWVSLKQLLLPAHCAACGAASPADSRMPLCAACGRKLAALIETGFCLRCGRAAGEYASNADGCATCRGRPLAYDGAVRLGSYEEPLRSLVLHYKYQRRAELGSVLGRLLAERLVLAPWADAVDIVVPVPLHWTRRMSRGFNQADGLAWHQAAACGRQLERRLLRVRPTPHQTRLRAGQRAENVRGAFRARGASRAAGKKVLLVDDVMTSGATVSECARALKHCGAAAVYVAVLAVARHDEPGPW